MNEQRTELLKLMRQYVGRQNAITKVDIAVQLRIAPRRVEHLIRSLIVESGINIVSACDTPAGYFIVENEDEARRYRNQLISRMRKLSERLRAVDENLARRIQRELFL